MKKSASTKRILLCSHVVVVNSCRPRERKTFYFDCWKHLRLFTKQKKQFRYLSSRVLQIVNSNISMSTNISVSIRFNATSYDWGGMEKKKIAIQTITRVRQIGHFSQPWKRKRTRHKNQRSKCRAVRRFRFSRKRNETPP